MTTATIAGNKFELNADLVESVASDIDPEPVKEHYAVIRGRRFPPKQVLAAVTGVDRADFTTHQARAILRRLGFGVYRRSGPPTIKTPDPDPWLSRENWPHKGAEADALEPHMGRWVAQEADGYEVVYVADDVESVIRWVRRHGLRARVWRVPSHPHEMGSFLTTPPW